MDIVPFGENFRANGDGADEHQVELEPVSDMDLATEDAHIEFNNHPLRSWIPNVLLAIISVVLALLLSIVFGLEQYWYVSLTLLTLSVTLVLRARSEEYIVDKPTRKFVIQRRRLFRSGTITIPFHEIKDIKLEESTDVQGGSETDLYLLLRSGKRVQLIAGSLCGFAAQRKRHIYASVSEILSSSKKTPRTRSRTTSLSVRNL
jgi:hypothetical protein